MKSKRTIVEGGEKCGGARKEEPRWVRAGPGDLLRTRPVGEVEKGEVGEEANSRRATREREEKRRRSPRVKQEIAQPGQSLKLERAEPKAKGEKCEPRKRERKKSGSKAKRAKAL